MINEGEENSDGLKVLNLYAGIGGNRKLWKNVDVTAVEIDTKIATVYKKYFPKDRIVIGDAHEYLKNHFDEFDFIWSSPPCQSHSSMRQNLRVRYSSTKPIYPDMRLYQEIIFLKYNFDGLWIVENVNPYYDTLIEPTVKLHRHLFWSNFNIPEKEFETSLKIRSSNSYKEYEKVYGFKLSDTDINNKRQVLRNCVKPEIGKYILDLVMDRRSG